MPSRFSGESSKADSTKRSRAILIGKTVPRPKIIEELYGADLSTRGWTSYNLDAVSDSALTSELISLANQLGTPVASRAGRQICEKLCPTDAKLAKPNSLSARFFLVRAGALFPFYRTSAICEQLMGQTDIPGVLFYPGSYDCVTGLSFMGANDAEPNYRPKIF